MRQHTKLTLEQKIRPPPLRDSNLQPFDLKSGALTNKLFGLGFVFAVFGFRVFVVVVIFVHHVRMKTLLFKPLRQSTKRIVVKLAVRARERFQ